MPREFDGDVEDVDMSGIPKRSGLTFYASTSLEQNSRGLNAKSTAYVTYNPPPGKRVDMSIELFTQIHQAVVKRAWERTNERKLAYEFGNETPVEQFEVDLISGEITE